MGTPMRAATSDASADATRPRRRLRLGLAIASGPLAAALLLACYLWASDRTLLGEIVTIWPPVGWGFLLLVRAAVLLIRRQKRVALATLVATVAFLVGTTEWKPLMRAWGGPANPPASASADTLPLRLVVWNVAGSSPLAELKTLSPDLCLFQEIGALSAAVRRSSDWGGYHVLEGFDPGILSRYPMRRLPAERVGPWTDPLIALVELPGDRRVVVVNVRLTLPGIALSMAPSPGESPRAARSVPASGRAHRANPARATRRLRHPRRGLQHPGRHGVAGAAALSRSRRLARGWHRLGRNDDGRDAPVAHRSVLDLGGDRTGLGPRRATRHIRPSPAGRRPACAELPFGMVSGPRERARRSTACT
jgi:hypothetical protein